MLKLYLECRNLIAIIRASEMPEFWGTFGGLTGGLCLLFTLFTGISATDFWRHFC